MGLKAVVIKRGEYGATLFTKDGYFVVPAYPLESVFDPTGAGDTFAGGFMGYLASQNEITDDRAAPGDDLWLGDGVVQCRKVWHGTRRCSRLSRDQRAVYAISSK